MVSMVVGGGGCFSCIQMTVRISSTGDAEDGRVWQRTRGVRSLWAGAVSKGNSGQKCRWLVDHSFQFQHLFHAKIWKKTMTVSMLKQDPNTYKVMMKWGLMSSDVSWHIRDKLWPMPKHGSIILYVHGNRRTAQDGHLDSHTAPELWRTDTYKVWKNAIYKGIMLGKGEYPANSLLSW